jgi:hypothetical protein
MQTPEKTSTRTNAKHRIDLTKATSWTLLGVGVAALILSIIYASSILTFIGLGLLFWGALTLYITTEKYVKEILLNSTLLPRLANMDKILTELGYQGKAVYLPPKYLKDPETSARL